MPKGPKPPPASSTVIGKVISDKKIVQLPHHSDYHDEFPREDGPPPVKAGESRDIYHDQVRLVAFHLDHGAFIRVWEMVEAEAKTKWPSRKTMANAEAVVRAATSFRKAWANRDF